MPGFTQRLQAGLAQRREAGLYRGRDSIESPQGPKLCLAGREYLNFCSNDYLGLAAHPKIVESFKDAAQKFGVGSGASHLVCGHSSVHQELEHALAVFTKRPRALLFSSGYMANLGVLGALLEPSDHVFQDKLNHASLIDGGLRSGARFRRFLHNDLESLELKLSGASGEKLVAVDGVFSMDGDEAPLREMAGLCSRHNAWLMVDDAHGFGVNGPSGAGSVEAAGLGVADVPVLMATLGKALGTAGAFVAGDETLIEALIQQARTYIYTTAIPPAVAAATIVALQVLGEESWRREHLRSLVSLFRTGAEQLGLPLMPSSSAIQPLVLGGADQAVALSRGLRERGVLVSAIRPPTVPRGTSRLRITLSAAHSAAQVEQLLEQLEHCWPDV